MIINAAQLINSSILKFDVCIIGGGPAAITVALELKDSGKAILMITGGDWNETSFNQDLNRGIIGLDNCHEPLEENRRRQFGGATAVWGGRCIPFDPIDFEQRPWIPHSGWPLTYNDLLPFYEKATELCLVGNFSFNAHTTFKDKREIIDGINDKNILSWPMERWSPPINFARYYKAILETSNNIKVLLNCNVKRINADGDQINSVDVASTDAEFTINADTFVLATGGIENARLLLASKSASHPNGLGNNRDNVGRYYMSHINGTFAELDLFNRKNIIFNFEKDKDVYTRRRWWISEKFQKENQIGNIIMFLHHASALNGHRDALFSSVYLTKSFLSIVKQKSSKKILSKYKQLKPAIKQHAKNVFSNGFSLIPQIASLATKRFSKRRLPYVLPSIKSKYLGLYFQSEHMPNPASRITLSNQHYDALGIPRAVVNIAFSDIDIQTILKAHHLFINRYITATAGEMLYNESALLEYINGRISNFNSAAHHLGTTRMADKADDGVVDVNCRVFGINNLYIARSSVFPTGGHANPTLTIVALSARLGNYLKAAL